MRSVPGDSTRPITDRTKESLFNILGADILQATFLDLFAGRGSVGIEALSRGAYKVCFVDLNRLPIITIRENLRITGLGEGAEILQMDAFSFLEHSSDRDFDYIYIAPPQYKGMWKRALLMVDTTPQLLSEDGWVIVQIHPVELEELSTSESLINLEEFDRRQYGSTLLMFYERK